MFATTSVSCIISSRSSACCLGFAYLKIFSPNGGGEKWWWIQWWFHYGHKVKKITLNKWVFPKIVGFSPQIIHFNMVFHYIPSILGYPYFRKHPNPSCHRSDLSSELIAVLKLKVSTWTEAWGISSKISMALAKVEAIPSRDPTNIAIAGKMDPWKEDVCPIEHGWGFSIAYVRLPEGTSKNVVKVRPQPKESSGFGVLFCFCSPMFFCIASRVLMTRNLALQGQKQTLRWHNCCEILVDS